MRKASSAGPFFLARELAVDVRIRCLPLWGIDESCVGTVSANLVYFCRFNGCGTALVATLSEDVLTKIPFASTIIALGKVGVAFSDRLLIFKIQNFLVSLNVLSERKRAGMISRLETDLAYGRRVGEHLVERLERIESHRKSVMTAFTLAAYTLVLAVRR